MQKLCAFFGAAKRNHREKSEGSEKRGALSTRRLCSSRRRRLSKGQTKKAVGRWAGNAPFGGGGAEASPNGAKVLKRFYWLLFGFLLKLKEDI